LTTFGANEGRETATDVADFEETCFDFPAENPAASSQLGIADQHGR
jgi:hypothetical protein